MIRTAHRPAVRTAAAAMLPLLIFCLLAAHAADTAAVTADRMRLCLETLIPSLFGCMAAANLLTGTGAAAWLGMRLSWLARRLHLPPELLTVFLVSQIAGYPVGTMLLRQMVRAGRLDAQSAGQYASICFGGGPAFAVGFAGCRMFGRASVGWMMLGGCILANIILLLLRPKPDLPESAPPQVHLSAEALPDAVSAAMRSLTAVCGMVLCFGLLMLLCDLLGITALPVRLGGIFGLSEQRVRALMLALSDITQMQKLLRCGFPIRLLIALSGALLSFGGICVHLQCRALSGGFVRMRHLLCARLSAAALTFLILYVLSGFFDTGDAAAVLAFPAAVSRSGSLLPAILIFCTGFPFLIKKD